MLDASLKLYRYRWLVYEMVLRNVRLRYRGSVLGVIWTLLNPLIFMAIYTVVFSVYRSSGIHNYPLYLLSGIIPFNFFATALLQGTTGVLDGRFYVGKTLFPTVVLVVVPVLTNAVNFVISMPLVLVLALASGVHLGWSLLLLPLVFIIELFLVQAAVTILATMNVFFRDVHELVTSGVTVLFFMTPIFYQETIVPAKFFAIVTLNPLAALIESYHHILFSGTMPSFPRLGFALIVSLVGLVVANATFERYRESFSQYL